MIGKRKEEDGRSLILPIGNFSIRIVRRATRTIPLISPKIAPKILSNKLKCKILHILQRSIPRREINRATTRKMTIKLKPFANTSLWILFIKNKESF